MFRSLTFSVALGLVALQVALARPESRDVEESLKDQLRRREEADLMNFFPGSRNMEDAKRMIDGCTSVKYCVDKCCFFDVTDAGYSQMVCYNKDNGHFIVFAHTPVPEYRRVIDFQQTVPSENLPGMMPFNVPGSFEVGDKTFHLRVPGIELSGNAITMEYLCYKQF